MHIHLGDAFITFVNARPMPVRCHGQKISNTISHFSEEKNIGYICKRDIDSEFSLNSLILVGNKLNPSVSLGSVMLRCKTRDYLKHIS
jgi:hypothetical protein